jgi:hypothetical protein
VPSTRLGVSVVFVALLAGEARAGQRPPDRDVWLTAAAPRRPAAGVVVAAHDPGRGVPSLVRTPRAGAEPGLSAEAAARLHLERHRHLYGVPADALAGLRLRFVHDTRRGGIVVVLRQTVDGVDVFHGDVKLLLDRAHRLLGIAGAPHPAAHRGAARPVVGDDLPAVAAALHDRHGRADLAPRLRPAPGRPGWRHYDLAAGSGPRMDAPARVRPVQFPVGDALVPARLVELQTRDAGGHSVYQYVIAADDGRVLHRQSATANEAFTYRVWADVDGDHRPADGPLLDFTPHPTGVPGDGPAGVAAPALITIDGFHSAGDPWLPPGATETRGNNVDAYVDHLDPSGLDLDAGEFRGAVSSPGVFDWTYDTVLEPLATPSQSMAAITTLFYINNWMHDWWYDSGFDERAGNAQADNFGRGGEDGDVLLAEAQDAAMEGTRNNANMSTPLDGASPRMQMYLWTGLYTEAILGLAPLDQEFTGGMATFGPKNFGVKGPLVRVEDGAGVSPTDGCEPAQVDLTDAIALVDRGECTFETKVAHAADAGALGVVIIDNVESAEPIAPGNDEEMEDPPLPTIGVTNADGAVILAALADGEQFAHLNGSSSVERDGTVDGMIVAHEWGHYLHRRLVECGSSFCSAESEGWADFNALMMALREGDDLHGSYAASTYANFDESAYFGIRRVPYSVDFARNALTFRHIADGEPLPDSHPIDASGAPNSQVHNAGEVWATMMWEVYIALHEAHAADMSFEEVRRLMGDYIVTGMMMTPPSPTYLEQRDALLLAVSARSQDDFVTVAGAFARRGAGSCAVSPPKHSTTFVGVVEDFELGASGTLLGAGLVELDACDGDGVVDRGEGGRISVDVYNAGVLPLPAGAVLEVVDPDPGLVFAGGPSVALPAVPPLATQSATLDFTLADDVAARRPVTLRLRLAGMDACDGDPERVLRIQLAADVAPDSASVDDVEAEPSPWTRDGGGSDTIWARLAAADGFYWHADAVGRTSDTFLISPPLQVGDQALQIGFDHAHSFERADGVNYDGGVVELSRDDGETWEDITKFAAAPGYGGVITAEGNPLHTRSGYVGTNESWPDRDREELLLGTKLAGETVRLRFRVGTDGGVGAPGWDIDNIAVTGLTNAPFPTWADDPGCDDTGTVPTTGDASEGADTDTSGGSGPQADDDDGCGCTGGPAGAPWLLLLPALARRRRGVPRRRQAPPRLADHS